VVELFEARTPKGKAPIADVDGRIAIEDGDKFWKITLTPDLSAFNRDIGLTQMIIDDYIPTGMRFERYNFDRWSRNVGWHLVSRQGQRMQFCVYGAGRYSNLEPIVYYARCATPGEYVVESAYISSNFSDIWGASQRSTVLIK